jgi:hypothetical protein
MPERHKKKAFPLVQTFLDELEWSTAKKYVEVLRAKGQWLEVGLVDVDLAQIVDRRFRCDARRCIHWEGDRPLVDRSCCCRYDVPVTGRDRTVVLQHLDRVRPGLPANHRLRDPSSDAFEMDDDFGFQLVQDNPLGGCQFNLYLEGRCRCALHLTALKLGENPMEWKPLACSLWPLAVISYDDDGEERYLLTVYCAENADLFDETEDEPFACLVDQDPSYPPLYQAERPTLESLFGEAWWRRLHAAAEKRKGAGREGKIKTAGKKR